MATVVTFVDYTPVSRLDGISWTTAQIEEAPEEDGDYTLIDTIPLVPDVDPEFPATRSFTTILGTTTSQWYRVRFFDANGDNSEYTEPIQNIAEDFFATPYAGTSELARILKLRAPTADQLVAMERVLETAALEIDAELGRNGTFGTPYPSLVVQVNLERAVEHWQQQEAAFGIIGLGGVDTIAVHTARDTWDRHAHKLAPLKDTWGIGVTVRQIMDALGNQIQTHLVPLVPDLQVFSRMHWNPSPPTIDLYPDPEFQQGLGFGRGDNALFFTVRARVNTPDVEGAQDVLLAMMDPQADTSVAAAITAAGTASPAKTLGGTVENAVVVSGPSDFGVFSDPGGSGALLGCTWRVQVIP